ncbi:MAG: hypothetical protein Q8O67_25795 [Deltaproteobacteria bacterium]|nr:hypothetical protein [Deltaproteobacteria bacterium]
MRVGWSGIPRWDATLDVQLQQRPAGRLARDAAGTWKVLCGVQNFVQVKQWSFDPRGRTAPGCGRRGPEPALGDVRVAQCGNATGGTAHIGKGTEMLNKDSAAISQDDNPVSFVVHFDSDVFFLISPPANVQHLRHRSA